MSRSTSDSKDSSLSSTPGTIPLPPRLRLLAATEVSQTELLQANESTLSAAAREQLLRGKQLLLQIKELSQARPPERLQQTLAMLSLAIRCVQERRISPLQIEEIRLVLDRVTHELNEQSQEQRREQVQRQRRELFAGWIEKAVHLAEWSLEPVRDLARELQREYHHHAPPLYWYDGLPTDPPLWAAAHGLNSAQVVLRMLVRANTTSTDLFNAIVAGLLHDAGMAHLPARVLSAQEGATSSTRQQWRQHPIWTADRVRPVLHPAEFEVAAAIAQHHERLDGSGYPQQLTRDQLGSLSRQLSVADSYAALCQPRPHRPAHSPRAALQLLLKDVQAGRLDESAVLLLLPWGLAPVGSVVELSDGTQAEVVAWGAGSGFGLDARPVLVRYPQRDRIPIVDLEQARQRHIVKVLTPQEIRDSFAWRETKAS
jgi:HD-GYP domain-containing protein (c-di-GMP phosphodiesterase class II)